MACLYGLRRDRKGKEEESGIRMSMLFSFTMGLTVGLIVGMARMFLYIEDKAKTGKVIDLEGRGRFYVKEAENDE